MVVQFEFHQSFSLFALQMRASLSRPDMSRSTAIYHKITKAREP